MLGWVAAVSATESPSQPSPPFIHRMCTTGSAADWAEPSLVSVAVAICRPPPPSYLSGWDLGDPAGCDFGGKAGVPGVRATRAAGRGVSGAGRA